MVIVAPVPQPDSQGFTTAATEKAGTPESFCRVISLEEFDASTVGTFSISEPCAPAITPENGDDESPVSG
jgi:hypothetical protein